MNRSHLLVAAALVAALAWSQCGTPERDNPVDPRSPASVQESGLQLRVALPKPLVSVVDSIVATLEGPTIPTITKELAHSPEGPATLTIGALAPGSGFSLTIRGYDHDGQLILQGEQDGITISVGDTTDVTLLLELVPTGGDG
jgi:hypothetical protein